MVPRIRDVGKFEEPGSLSCSQVEFLIKIFNFQIKIQRINVSFVYKIVQPFRFTQVYFFLLAFHRPAGLLHSIKTGSRLAPLQRTFLFHWLVCPPLASVTSLLNFTASFSPQRTLWSLH